MALHKKSSPAGVPGNSLKRLIAQVEITLNREMNMIRKFFPKDALLEKPAIERNPRQRKKVETGECPVYSGEEEVSSGGRSEGLEKEITADIAAKKRFPEKG